MMFKIFKHKGIDVIINIDNIVSIKADETSGKTIIQSIGQSIEVDESFDEVKLLFGVGPKKQIKGF
jgi:prefoldin subunit 5